MPVFDVDSLTPVVAPPAAVDDVLATVGDTPVVRLGALERDGGPRLVAKLEYLGPGGAITDRAAKAVVDAQLGTGGLSAEKRAFAAGGGDGVISLAMACSARGVPFTAVVPKALYLERKKALVDYGAKLVSVDVPDLASAEAEARRRAREAGGTFLDLLRDPVVIEAYASIGRELVASLGAVPDATIVGLDLGAIPLGVARGVGGPVVVVEPAAARVGSGGAFGAHLLGGLVPSADVLPQVREFQRFEAIDDAAAFAMAGRLTRGSGLLVGIVSGAVAVAAERVAAALGPSATVACVFPDSGERRFMLAPFFAAGA